MPPIMGIVIGYEFRAHRLRATDHDKNASAELIGRSRAAGAYLASVSSRMSRVTRIPRLAFACVNEQLSEPLERFSAFFMRMQCGSFRSMMWDVGCDPAHPVLLCHSR